MRGAAGSAVTRALLFVVLLFGLAACAGAERAAPSPADIAGPPIAYPPETKRRILAIAIREWQEFGAPEVDYSMGTARPIFDGVREDDPRVFPNVLAYWNAVRNGWEDYIRDQKTLYQAGQGGVWTDAAWSAAFISYVMRSAGVDHDDFPWSAGHRNYVDALIERHATYGLDAVFHVYDLEQYAPRPGDLICADRSLPASQRITSVAERVAEFGASRGMHCDIVVDVQPGRVAAIGGNVGHSVTRSWFPTDESGRLLRFPAGYGDRTFFAVIRTNIPDDAPIAVG